MKPILYKKVNSTIFFKNITFIILLYDLYYLNYCNMCIFQVDEFLVTC